MCGIAGVWGMDIGSPGRVAAVRAMTACQVHRGPDESGFLEHGDVALGARRLSIIDLPSGQQPIFNEERTVAVVFNGEIYNYRELHRELAARGHGFKTRSDTETIVHAYEEWGDECVRRFRGMFAFAILDWRSPSGGNAASIVHSPRLLLARDRFGIKPLYWYRTDGGLAFASEVRALLGSGLVPKKLSTAGVASYLAFGSVQEPLTLIQGAHSLEPGHRLVVTHDGRAMQLTDSAYWDLPSPEEVASEQRQPRRDLLRQVRQQLEEAVTLHTRSDVSYGAFLSSGLDSNAIVALLATASAEPVRTFTITFDELGFSEAALARRVAARFGTDHSEILVRSSEVLAELPAAVRAMDQPSIDGVNTFYVSRAARQAGLKVALSGLGGDEIFAGYPTFKAGAQLRRIERWLPRNLRHWLGKAPMPKSDRWRKLQTALAGAGYFDHPYFTLRALFTPGQRDTLLAGTASEVEIEPWEARARWSSEIAARYDAINAISYLECKHYLPSTLLRDADSMSMAHSLEVRVPLIDHELAETVFRQPGREKVDHRVPKPLLVGALGDLLLPEVIQQRKKTFTFPWQDWLLTDLRQTVEHRLGVSGTGVPLINRESAQRVWTDFLGGRTSWSRPWSLYVLAAWIERHLD